MKQLVIMPGGFHPFHAGHLALYQSALQAFPGADVKVAATNDTSSRPFPFKLKEKLAQLAGVSPGDFYQVKSPFRAEEITKNYDPADTQLIFVRSEKDAAKPPQAGGIKRDGTPGYLQPISDRMAPMTQNAYMAYLPTVTFGPGMRSATEIRTAWPSLDERRRMALVMSLYPNTQKNPKLAKTVVKMLDTAMGAELTEVLDTKASTATSQWDTSDTDMIKFNFTASNGVRYQLDFLEPYIGPDEMSPYDFFDSDEVYNKSKFVSFEQITQDMKGGHPVAKQGIEGTGSAAEVFGIVINAIIQYVKKARPALLYFQAAEPNRRALYARIIRRILPDLPGWDSTADDAGQFAIYNRRAIKSAMSAEVAEATGDERFDNLMGRMQKEPRIPDSQMPPTDVKDLYHWAVENHKPYHKIFAHWANREGFKSVAQALQKAGNLDSDALDYWTPDVWKLWYGPDAEMPRYWSKERVPDELRDYLEGVFDAYDNIVFDWPTEYRQIDEQGLTDTDGPGVSFDSAEGFKNTIRQKLGGSDPELNTNIDQLVVADPDGTVDVDQTLFNMLKEFDELMPQILQFVKDITAKFIETSQSIEFQQASPADQQSLLQSIKDMQAMLPGLEKQVVDARAKFQQNAPIMQQNIQTKAAAAKPVPPVVKEQGIAEGHRIVTELRNTMYKYLKSIVPKWPDYVVQDWLYKGRGKDKTYNTSSKDIKSEVIEMISDAGLTTDTQWQLVPDMKFTMDMFDPMTKQRLIGRAGGHSDLGMGIPRDKERHATQSALAQQQGGVRKEPVLLIKTAKGYELLEGWHRTIQHFAKYPDGYKGPAYVAVARGQQGMDEQVTRQMSQGGLRASYQSKYNQPMMEDYLDEARS